MAFTLGGSCGASKSAHVFLSGATRRARSFETLSPSFDRVCRALSSSLRGPCFPPSTPLPGARRAAGAAFRTALLLRASARNRHRVALSVFRLRRGFRSERSLALTRWTLHELLGPAKFLVTICRFPQLLCGQSRACSDPASPRDGAPFALPDRGEQSRAAHGLGFTPGVKRPCRLRWHRPNRDIMGVV